MKRVSTLVGTWILSSFLGAPLALAGDIQEVEAVGVVALRPESTTGSARDAAVRNGLQEVVEEAALVLLRDEGNVRPVGVGEDDAMSEGAYGAFGFEEPPPVEPPVPREFLANALGKDPYEFVTRLQVIEDRGERPALFSSDPEVESEYVVVIRVSIDRDRIRERLVGAGMSLDSAKDSRRIRVRLALIGMDDYAAYETIRNALIHDLGMRSAVPVEIEPGRLILELEANQNPSEFLEPLRRALPAHLDVIPVVVDDYAATLQVEVREPQAPEPASPGSSPIDTPNPNRY